MRHVSLVQGSLRINVGFETLEETLNVSHLKFESRK